MSALRRASAREGGVAACAAALAGACALSVAVGSRSVAPAQVWSALTDPAAQGVWAEAVRLRVPRTVLGLLAGAALAVAGALMQGATRNPLADPGLLGVNAGAALAVVCGMAFVGLSTPGQYVWLACAGAGGAAALVWAVGSLGPGGPTPLKLALAGAVAGIMLSALTSAVLLPRADVIATFRFWQVGGIGGARLATLSEVAPFFLVGFALAALAAPALNALALGDAMAAGLGGSVGRARLLAACAAVLLCGASTALAGPIGFVGLVVPHAARTLVGTDYRAILALCLLLGPLLLLVADVVGRVIARPGDVEVGIVMALLGAPVFVAMVRRVRVGGL